MSNRNNIREGIFNTFNETPSQQQFVRNNSSFQPNSTFYNTSNNISSRGQNINSWEQHNLKSNFSSITPIVNPTDFTFKNNTLDPNLNSNLMNESLREFRINIDSNSRNIKIYPNAYNYTVFFGPITNSTNPLIDDVIFTYPDDQKIYDINKNIVINNNEKLKKSADPYISRNFTNVKYCRIDQLMLSKYNKVLINKNYLNFPNDEDLESFEYLVNDAKRIFKSSFPKMRYIPNMNIENSLFMDRYILLKIPELNDGRNLATRHLQAYTIYPDKFFSFSWLGKPYFALKEWEDSALGNINKLTIELFNSDGEPLTLNTNKINYETNFIKSVILLNPNIKINLNDKEIIFFYIRRYTEIIKAIVLINHKNIIKIKLHNEENCFALNKKDYCFSNIFEELDEFCDIVKGFKTVLKHNKKNVNINDFINNVIWFDCIKNNSINNETLQNLEIINIEYKKNIHNILNNLILEIHNLPLNRYYQNNISLVISCATNNLNTKINYENGN